VSSHGAKSTVGLRHCPICRSKAIRQIVTDDEDDAVRLWMRCGACETWRTTLLRASRAPTIERRLTRRLERDRRLIANDLRRVEQFGVAAEDFRVGRGVAWR
jgi:hypothetical protein